MNIINQLFNRFSTSARSKRAKIFKHSFNLTSDVKILDLGSENGSNIHSVLKDTQIDPENVYIADINEAAVAEGHKRYGFVPVYIDQAGRLPFNDNYFDIVYCSSVIEHVTVDKEKIWTLTSGKEFKDASLQHQAKFAQEICRVGRQYFVQTPYKYFPIESHSWLPFVGFLPRPMIVAIIRATNTFWVKKTTPDWYLLNKKELLSLFDGSKIVCEKALGLTKSIMAIKCNDAKL